MQRALKWLYPGIGVKRWLLLAVLGFAVASAGLGLIWGWWIFAFLETTIQYAVRTLIGESLLRAVAAGLGLLLLGAIVVSYSVGQVIRSIINVFSPEHDERLVELLVRQNVLARAPKIVAIGGGTGLPVLLRGLKDLTANLTAIVTVADDGGSSGRLRGELGILPPGDIRNCLLALADTEPLLEKLFQHRFSAGSGLEGHSFGNLFIAAMSEITGDFEVAVKESSKVLAVRGRVLPVSLDSVILCAEMDDGETVCGESRIAEDERAIKRVFVSPENATPLPEALVAISEADAIVFGPGSLYTSVIPNLLIPGIVDAIKAAKGIKLYICNVMTQPGETAGYSASQHLRAILDHTGEGIVDYVLVNTTVIRPELLEKYHSQGADVVTVDGEALRVMGTKIVAEDLITQDDFVRHEPTKLARSVFRLALQATLRNEGKRWRERYIKPMKEVEL